MAPLGDEYLVQRDDEQRLNSVATGSTPEEAAEAAVLWWKRRFPHG